MGAETVLEPVTVESRPVVERLWQLYRHDLSEFRGTLPDVDGTFTPGRLPRFYDDPDRAAYLVQTAARPTGFALVRGLSEAPAVVGEFFVVRAARRQGVGHDAALDLFRRHPGTWEIPFQEENPGAARFWRRVATAAVGDTWCEEPRPVPGRPEVPPDVWITLDTRGPKTTQSA